MDDINNTYLIIDRIDKSINSIKLYIEKIELEIIDLEQKNRITEDIINNLSFGKNKVGENCLKEMIFERTGNINMCYDSLDKQLKEIEKIKNWKYIIETYIIPELKENKNDRK